MIKRIRLMSTTATDRARERGASAVEYGLMVAAIAAVIVGVVFGLGQYVSNAFEGTSQCLAQEAAAVSPDCADIEAPAAPAE